MDGFVSTPRGRLRTAARILMSAALLAGLVTAPASVRGRAMGTRCGSGEVMPPR